MPRQGARRARAASRGSRHLAAAAVIDTNNSNETPAQAGVCSVAPRSAKVACADFDAALAAPGDTTEKLFELANKPGVSLSVGGRRVSVAHDPAATEHSGGVVWETAFFLARYLERYVLKGYDVAGSGLGASRLRVVELGAGCGLLGLALSQLGCEVLLTEQPVALGNLRANIESHVAGVTGGGPVEAAQLVWGDRSDITAVCERGPFDLVVASDVVFATRLVEPLLQSIASLLYVSRSAKAAEVASGTDGRDREQACWLCLQQRDPDAHATLLSRAPSLFRVQELSFAGLAGFEAATELDCVLLRLRPRKRGAEVEGVHRVKLAEELSANEALTGSDAHRDSPNPTHGRSHAGTWRKDRIHQTVRTTAKVGMIP